MATKQERWYTTFFEEVATGHHVIFYGYRRLDREEKLITALGYCCKKAIDIIAVATDSKIEKGLEKTAIQRNFRSVWERNI